MPIRPVKGQMVCLKMPKSSSLLKHILWRENVYLVPRDNFDLIIAEPSFPDPPINKTFLFILNQTPNINNCFIFFYF